MVGHLAKWKHVSLEVLPSYAALGVHVFFVLSGYLITSLLLQEHETTSTINLFKFYARRAFRILPAAFVFLIVAVSLYWREIRWTHIAAAVFYLANMDDSRPWVFGHLWSLGIEEQFYLVWPFALGRWYRLRLPILIFVFCGTPVFRTLLYGVKAHGAALNSLPAVSDQLAVGCLLAIFAKRLPRIPGYLAALMTLATILIPLYPATSAGRTLFMLFLLRPLLHVSIAGIVLHVIQVPYGALNWGPVAWLGKISYSLYLWQELFCSNPNLHYGYVLALPAIGCACLSYYIVERPMLRWRESLSERTERRSSPILAHT